MYTSCPVLCWPSHKTIVWAGGVYIKGLEMYFANKHCKRYISSLFDLGLGAAYGSLKVLCCLGVVPNLWVLCRLGVVANQANNLLNK